MDTKVSAGTHMRLPRYLGNSGKVHGGLKDALSGSAKLYAAQRERGGDRLGV